MFFRFSSKEMTLIKVWNLLLLLVAVPSSFAAHPHSDPHDCEKTCYDRDVMDCEYTFTVETYDISCLNLSNNNIFWLLFRFKSFDPV